ncbi:hypothetical protein D3C81_1221300 [compost metagenome]
MQPRLEISAMNSNPVPESNTTDPEDKSSIGSKIHAMDLRMNRLENPEHGRFEIIQKRTSFLALLIGILLSAISLFDMFWSQPRNELFRDMEEFNKSVNAVSNLRQNMIQIQHQSNNPQMLMAMNSMVSPQVLANIQYATALLPRLGDHAGIPQLLVLISEALNIYDWKSATTLVERAVAIKDAVPSMQSEARRYKARLMFSTGKIQEGRAAFQDSLNVLRGESAFGINGARAYIIADWAISEFAMGDCNSGNERIGQFIQLLQDPEILPLPRLGLISTLKNQLEQIQSRKKRCAFPKELEDAS